MSHDTRGYDQQNSDCGKFYGTNNPAAQQRQFKEIEGGIGAGNTLGGGEGGT